MAVPNHHVKQEWTDRLVKTGCSQKILIPIHLAGVPDYGTDQCHGVLELELKMFWKNVEILAKKCNFGVIFSVKIKI